MANNILADGVKNVPHIKVFNDMTAQRFEDLERSPLLIYMIDTVSPNALPYLAEQFDVLGIKGMKYADTVQKQRDLIKKAIELHKYKGTPWAVKESLKAIGVIDCTIIEGSSIANFFYDGVYLYDGSITYGFNGWAVFRVLIDIFGFPYATTAVLSEMRQLIEEYKPESRTLLDVSFSANVDDTLTYAEEFSFSIQYQGDFVGSALLYDGSGLYDGTYYYDDVRDELVINIIVTP